MGLKYHTIICVPHARAKFLKWRISNRQIQFVSALLVLLTVGAGVITTLYFTTVIDKQDLEKLQLENKELREVNLSFENSIRNLQQQLSDYEDRTKELAIVLGLNEGAQPEGEETARGFGAGGTDSYQGTGYDLALIESRAKELDSRLGKVQEEADEQILWISATPAIMPAKGIFTSGFGYRRDPLTGRRAFHNGLDISARRGNEVHAAADGIVTRAGTIGSLGRAVYLSHGFGYTTRYGHLLKIQVTPGQKVKRGDVLGRVGNSGRSTGYHLHYEVRKDSKPVNPLKYILDLPGRRY